jgi:multidrug efflux pump subunit AcrA (membrane-fusion protein)
MLLNFKPAYLFIFAYIFVLSCNTKNATIKADITEPTVTNVSLVSPITENFTDAIQLNGNTAFQKKLVIRANITGYIKKLNYKIGDNIKSGALFCSIKTKEQDALKNIDQRDPSLQQFQLPIKIYTSASGFLTAVNYIEGDFVNEGDVLATITDPASLVLIVNVPYEVHQYVYSGRSCEVELPDGRKIPSTITKGIPVIDTASQTEQFYIHLPSKLQLPEGMNMLVKIPTTQKVYAIALPLAAIQTNETQDQFWVMKMINDSMAIRVPVTVGLQNDSLKEILSGVSINDKIVSDGAYGLSDSSLVKIESEKK